MRGDMSTITDIQERLALYKKAERVILEGNQSYTIGGQTFAKADLGRIQSMIRGLELQLSTACSGGFFGARPVVFGGRR